MPVFALAKNNFYQNIIVADQDFIDRLISEGEIDFATELEEEGSSVSPGDPVPVFYEPANEADWDILPSDLRDATDRLASRPSFAVDKGDVNDQQISGTDWTKVTAERILWNSGFYDLADSWFIVPKDGTYNHDVQMRFSNLSNVASIEIALFMVIDGGPGDYWFTLGKVYPPSGLTEIHIGNSTQFDFYTGERYYLAVQLTPIDVESECSATILGSDDFTAWGSNWTAPIINGYRS